MSQWLEGESIGEIVAKFKRSSGKFAGGDCRRCESESEESSRAGRSVEIPEEDPLC
jgi:hypothetical protein